MLFRRIWGTTAATAVALFVALLSDSVYAVPSHGLDSFPVAVPPDEDVSECILLFGAFCNGNMGDVMQASTMSRLVSNIATHDRCVWHAHPGKEDPANGFREGEFFGGNASRVISLGCDRESGEQVSKFKGLVIGGGGLFEARHWPLDCETFVDGIRDDLPVAIFGVGANGEAESMVPIVRRANYASGRDKKSIKALAELLDTLDNPRVDPNDVARVRDPVLSDSYYTDKNGTCWRHSKGHPMKKPLCFVLPSAQTEELQALHRVYASEVVRQGDVLLNVFPKHQAEIEAFPYPAEVIPVLDPAEFAGHLCGCRAVVSSRLHGTILALHSGVPTIAAWPAPGGNKVPDLMNDVLLFPDQFFLIEESSLTRKTLSVVVDAVRKAYATGRREQLFERLYSISQHTQKESVRMLQGVFGLGIRAGVANVDFPVSGSGWKEPEAAPQTDSRVAVWATGESLLPVEGGGVMPLSENEESAGSRMEHARDPEFVRIASPWGRLWEKWGSWGEGGGTTPPVVGKEASYAGSPAVSLGTLFLIMLLGLPSLASLSGSTEAKPSDRAGDVLSVGKAASRGLSESGLVAVPPCRCLSNRRPWRLSEAVFFGVNYSLWVVLAMGFNICSKTYMRETRNPVALLTIQGWVGIAGLWVMNLVAQYRQRLVSLATPSSSSSSAPSWMGKCGPNQARRVGRGVWQAGLLHSANAILTSWSVLVGGVAATHALKALEPVAAAGFSRWLLGSTLPPGRVAAVTIIVLGLGILMVPLRIPRWADGSGEDAEIGSEAAGMDTLDLAIPAMLSGCACCAIALRNVLLKRYDPPPPPLALLVCSIVGAAVGSIALLVPFLPCSWEWAGEPLLRASGVNAALCFTGYNLASFNLLSELSPVGHAVGNAGKRACLFATGLFLLGEEGSMSPRQLAGASVAFLGLTSYNLAGASSRPSPTPLR